MFSAPFRAAQFPARQLFIPASRFQESFRCLYFDATVVDVVRDEDQTGAFCEVVRARYPELAEKKFVSDLNLEGICRLRREERTRKYA